MHMDELKSQKIWFCWNYETRKGKRTKVPISAYGTPTGTNAPYAGTWVTYDEAVKAAKKHGYNGVGFKIPEGYFFLDIDHKDMSNPFIVVLTCDGHDSEKKAVAFLRENTKRCSVKSKSAQKGAVEVNLEVRLKDDNTDFVNALSDLDGVESAVLVSYNGDYMG